MPPARKLFFLFQKIPLVANMSEEKIVIKVSQRVTFQILSPFEDKKLRYLLIQQLKPLCALFYLQRYIWILLM